MPETNDRNEDKSNNPFDFFLEEKNSFANLMAENFVEYFKEEKKPELELIEIYTDTFSNALRNAGLELKKYFDQSDTETRSLINNHVENTHIIKMLSSTNRMLEKKGKALGILHKISPIMEIIKKLLTHLSELFPNFLGGIIKKILIPILELIDNIFPKILELMSGKSPARYLKSAERHFLETHPLWRRLQFDTLDTTGTI